MTVPGGANLVGLGGSDATGDDIRGEAPRPAAAGERDLADVSGAVGEALPLAAAPAAWPAALGIVGGTALPAARQEFIPELNNMPGIGIADTGLGVIGGGLGASAGINALKWGLGTGVGRTVLRPMIGATPRTWYRTAARPATTGARAGLMGAVAPTIGEITDWTARNVLGLSPNMAQAVGWGVGTGLGYVLGGRGFPQPQRYTRPGALWGGGQEATRELSAPDITLPEVNVTAPVPQNQLAPQ